MWKYLNRGIPTPVVITIILVLIIAAGGFTWWQQEEIKEERLKIEQEREEQEELEEKRKLELQLLLEEINLLKEEAKLLRERSEREEKEEKQDFLKNQQEKEFQAWVNDCIIKAQNERDRRKRIIDDTWITCLELGVFTTEECEKYKDYSTVNSYYEEWKDNCERGIENNFPSQ